MRATQFIAAAASIVVATAQGTPKGFNYGNVFTDGTPKILSDFEAEFTKAQNLAGTSGFTSARLFTMIQAGTANTVISAIPAAINTNTRLLLGLWASAGQASFDNEVIALRNAIDQYGDDLLNLIDGISVGSEDLYRISPTGIENNSGFGANPQELVDYITQVRGVEGVPTGAIGHVDTWTAFVNSSNNAVIEALDWVGMDAYPYWQSTFENSIDNAYDLFFDALSATEAAAQGKPVWITETGWPTTGETQGDAVPSVENAEAYYSQVGCALFGDRPTWWYILTDSGSPNPSFSVLEGSSINNEPAYDLSCPADSSSSSVVPPVVSAAQSTAAAPTEAATTAVTSTVEIIASPGPVESPSTANVETVTSTEINTVVVSACPSSEVPATATAAPSAATTLAAPAPGDDDCPANLDGTFQFPHLIVPVSSAEPNTAYGTSYEGYVNDDQSSIFNFDIPAAYEGMTCSLVFLLPNREVLTTSNYEFNGQGGINVDELSAVANEDTTYDNKPETSDEGYGSISALTEGNSYVVATRECQAGARQSFEFSSTGGLELSWFQSSADGGIGAYISVC